MAKKAASRKTAKSSKTAREGSAKSTKSAKSARGGGAKKAKKTSGAKRTSGGGRGKANLFRRRDRARPRRSGDKPSRGARSPSGCGVLKKTGCRQQKRRMDSMRTRAETGSAEVLGQYFEMTKVVGKHLK